MIRQWLSGRRSNRGSAGALFIAGTQKGGTTSLHKTLLKHPGLRGPADPVSGEPIKEVSFFDEHWERGLDWYHSLFPGEEGPILDSTPNYLCDPHAHQRMAEAFPDARILVSLRDPVMRAYSAYNHYMQELDRTRGWDWAAPGEDFETNVMAELETYQSDAPTTKQLVGRGHYAVQLEHLFQHFPREQVRVTVLERWSLDANQLTRALLEDVGLKPTRLKERSAHRREKTVPPVSPEVLRVLHEHYAPHNRRLEELLGEEIPEWTR